MEIFLLFFFLGSYYDILFKPSFCKTFFLLSLLFCPFFVLIPPNMVLVTYPLHSPLVGYYTLPSYMHTLIHTSTLLKA